MAKAIFGDLVSISFNPKGAFFGGHKSAAKQQGVGKLYFQPRGARNNN